MGSSSMQKHEMEFVNLWNVDTLKLWIFEHSDTLTDTLTLWHFDSMTFWIFGTLTLLTLLRLLTLLDFVSLWNFESLTPWHFDTLKLRNFETLKRRSQKTKTSRNEETKQPRNQETQNSRNQETHKPRNRETKNQETTIVWNLSLFNERNPPPLNIPTPTPAPAPLVGEKRDLDWEILRLSNHFVAFQALWASDCLKPFSLVFRRASFLCSWVSYCCVHRLRFCFSSSKQANLLGTANGVLTWIQKTYQKIVRLRDYGRKYSYSCPRIPIAVPVDILANCMNGCHNYPSYPMAARWFFCELQAADTGIPTAAQLFLWLPGGVCAASGRKYSYCCPAFAVAALVTLWLSGGCQVGFVRPRSWRRW